MGALNPMNEHHNNSPGPPSPRTSAPPPPPTPSSATSDLGASSVGKRTKERGTAINFRKSDASFESITGFVIEELKTESKFYSENAPRPLPSFSKGDVELGAMLGSGEFGSVYEVLGFRADEAIRECQSVSSNNSSIESYPRTGCNRTRRRGVPRCVVVINNGAEEKDVTIAADDDSEGENEDETEELESKVYAKEEGKTVRIVLDDQAAGDLFSRNDDSSAKAINNLKSHMIANPMREGKPRYAVKLLRKDVQKDIRPDAIVDMACEAEFLLRIQHPNIIRLRATVGTQGSSSFMLVMDRLTETLTDKIDTWHAQYKQLKGPFINIGRRKNKDGLADLFTQRLLAAFDVARALRHLHNKGLVFRDVKPENIGVDPRGDFRLFDFGLCKELKAKDLVKAPDSYNATGATGSRRYMAPEVVKCLPYGFSADVYAFGILFWQIFALEVPFANFDSNRHFENVVVRGKRPHAIHAALQNNKLLHHVMEGCWSADPERRPRFVSVCQILQTELAALQGEREHLTISSRTKYLMDRSIKSTQKVSGMA